MTERAQSPTIEAIETPVVPILPDPASAPGAIRLHYIDGLRAVAMFMVLFFHTWQYGGRWRVGPAIQGKTLPLTNLLLLGHVGVNLFLVLSGFCLYWPLAHNRDRRLLLGDFARRRCRRILPPYYAVLAIFWLIPLLIAISRHEGDAARHIGGSILVHLAMLQNLFPAYLFDADGVTWSLALEFQLYLLFPLLVALFARLSPRSIVALTLLFSGTVRWLVLNRGLVTSATTGFLWCYGIWGRCFEFALGMWVADLVAHRHRTGRMMLRATDIAAGLAAVVAAVLSFRHATFGPQGSFWFLPLTDIFFGLIFGALLLAASLPQTWLHRALASPALVRIGLFSYSVYLIHLPVVQYVNARLLASGCHDFTLMLIDIGLVAPAVLLASYLFHLAFERPFMRSTAVRRP